MVSCQFLDHRVTAEVPSLLCPSHRTRTSCRCGPALPNTRCCLRNRMQHQNWNLRHPTSHSRCSYRRCRLRWHTCFRLRSRLYPRFRLRPSSVACRPSGRSLRTSSFPSSSKRWNPDGWRRRHRCMGCRPVLLFVCRNRWKLTRRVHTFLWRGYSPRYSARHRMLHRRPHWCRSSRHAMRRSRSRPRRDNKLRDRTSCSPRRCIPSCCSSSLRLPIQARRS